MGDLKRSFKASGRLREVVIEASLTVYIYIYTYQMSDFALFLLQALLFLTEREIFDLGVKDTSHRARIVSSLVVLREKLHRSKFYPPQGCSQEGPGTRVLKLRSKNTQPNLFDMEFFNVSISSKIVLEFSLHSMVLLKERYILLSSTYMSMNFLPVLNI